MADQLPITSLSLGIAAGLDLLVLDAYGLLLRGNRDAHRAYTWCWRRARA